MNRAGRLGEMESGIEVDSGIETETESGIEIEIDI